MDISVVEAIINLFYLKVKVLKESVEEIQK